MAMDELTDLIRRHARSGRTLLGDAVAISAVEHDGPPEYSITGTMLVLLAQGTKTLAVGDQVHTYTAGQTLVTSAELPATGHFVGASPDVPALGFSLVLKPALIAELLLQGGAGSRPQARRSTVPSGMSIEAADPELLDAVTRMVRLFERPRDAPVLAPLIERELTWLLLVGPHAPVVRQLGLADSGLSRIAHAVRWLRERYADAIRVDELARMTAMSPSAFHRSFLAVTAMSPIQFQKQLRLQEARIRLIADNTDVAGVAHSVGYQSPSQFSRDYRRRFGASPLDDSIAIRAAG
jgi:AraC-type DNA-binding domain-containing proteins